MAKYKGPALSDGINQPPHEARGSISAVYPEITSPALDAKAIQQMTKKQLEQNRPLLESAIARAYVPPLASPFSDSAKQAAALRTALELVNKRLRDIAKNDEQSNKNAEIAKRSMQALKDMDAVTGGNIASGGVNVGNRNASEKGTITKSISTPSAYDKMVATMQEMSQAASIMDQTSYAAAESSLDTLTEDDLSKLKEYLASNADAANKIRGLANEIDTHVVAWRNSEKGGAPY